MLSVVALFKIQNVFLSARASSLVLVVVVVVVTVIFLTNGSERREGKKSKSIAEKTFIAMHTKNKITRSNIESVVELQMREVCIKTDLFGK